MPVSESSKVFKGLGSQSIITMITGIIGVIYFAIMSRLLTRETFGYFAVITAVMVVINEVNSAGMGSAVIQRKNLENNFYYTAFSISVITGIFFSIIVFSFSSFLSECFTSSQKLNIPFKIVSVTLLLNNVCSVLRAQYMRKLQFFQFGTYQIVAAIISYSLGITMAFYGRQLAAIVMASVSNSLFLTAILLWFCRHDVKFKFERKYVNEIISYGGWLTASGVVRSLYEQIDKLLTTRWLSITALGAYNRPSGFVFQITSVINGIFDTTLFPILSGIQDNKNKIQAAYEKSIELTCIFSILMSFIMVLSARILTVLFLGNEWSDLIFVFQIASFTIIFLFLGRIGDSFFRSTGYVKDYFYVRVAVCVSSVIFVFVGCQFDIFGLAIGVLVSRIVDVFIKMFVLGKRLNIKQAPIVYKILTDIYIPTIMFALLYIIAFFSNNLYSYDLALIVFGLFMVFIIIKRPRTLGETFETVYGLLLSRFMHSKRLDD